MINYVVGAWLREILNINWPGVMITQSWVNWNILTLERVFDHLGYQQSSISNFFLGIIPVVVRSIVTSPKEQIWFHS
jgi:hypothetical protein